MTNGELSLNGYLAIVQKLKLLTTTKRCKMKTLSNIHPGEILHEEFLIPLGITAYRLSKDTGIPQTRVSAIIKGNRRITADTALRFSKYFGNSAKFWLGLQDDFDIEEENKALKSILHNIPQISYTAS